MGSFVAEVNKDTLRQERMAEIKADVEKILKRGKKFNISAAEIIAIIEEIKESQNGQYY